MATSIFDIKEIIPNDEDLEGVLKSSLDTFNKLISYLKSEYGSLNKEWKFYSKNAGWTLRISNKKRNLVFISPNDDYFLVNINMSVKVSKIVLDLDDVSDNTKELIKQGKVYAEGTSVLIEVRNKEDLEDIKTILNIRDN
ncbi:MAG: DUF3788 domain-containing protein [Methanobrevibacter sp.]|nr:DUF3788 domain-containing protein [Methanobrevibacter sp.]